MLLLVKTYNYGLLFVISESYGYEQIIFQRHSFPLRILNEEGWEGDEIQFSSTKIIILKFFDYKLQIKNRNKYLFEKKKEKFFLDWTR